jgi:hypothetical protein
LNEEKLAEHIKMFLENYSRQLRGVKFS